MQLMRNGLSHMVTWGSTGGAFRLYQIPNQARGCFSSGRLLFVAEYMALLLEPESPFCDSPTGTSQKLWTPPFFDICSHIAGFFLRDPDLHLFYYEALGLELT